MRLNMETYYKTFQGELPVVSGAYGYGQYDLTTLPAAFPSLEGEPVLCRNGYHFCKREHLVQHLSTHIAIVVIKGGIVWGEDKGVTCDEIVVRRLLPTWNPQTQQLFAADCAAKVAHLANDERVTNAITTARKFVLREATTKQLSDARAAAWDAARAAAWAAQDAARAAAWAAQTELLFDWLEGRRTLDTVRQELDS
jgi:hypothetical protein